MIAKFSSTIEIFKKSESVYLRVTKAVLFSTYQHQPLKYDGGNGHIQAQEMCSYVI